MTGAQKLHIVSFHAPAPLNHATAIDLYYFITELQQAGVDVRFHLLQEKSEVKLPETIAIYSYAPKKAIKDSLLRRRSKKSPIIHALLQDDAPIVFVGIRTSSIMNNKHLRKRKRIIRIHRIEKASYQLLYRHTRNLGKKIFYATQVYFLKRLEKKASKADMMLCTSERDTKYYARLNSNAYFLPVFHAYQKPNFMPGLGRYAIYFGDLSAKDNQQAVSFLLEKIFPFLKMPVIIAGKNPGAAIKNQAARHKHIILKPNPSAREMHDYIANAQVSILPGFQETGLKMQFLEALYRSRHVIVNTRMVEHTGLESLCTVKNQPLAIINTAHRLFKVPFDKTIKAKRRKLLLPHYYSPQKNAEVFMRLLRKS